MFAYISLQTKRVLLKKVEWSVRRNRRCFVLSSDMHILVQESIDKRETQLRRFFFLYNSHLTHDERYAIVSVYQSVVEQMGIAFFLLDDYRIDLSM